MTQREINKIALCIKTTLRSYNNIQTILILKKLIDLLSIQFKKSNPRFNKYIFKYNCGLIKGQKSQCCSYEHLVDISLNEWSMICNRCNELFTIERSLCYDVDTKIPNKT